MKHGIRGAHVGHRADVEAGQARVAGRVIEHGQSSSLHNAVRGQVNGLKRAEIHQGHLLVRTTVQCVLRSITLLPHVHAFDIALLNCPHQALVHGVVDMSNIMYDIIYDIMFYTISFVILGMILFQQGYIYDIIYDIIYIMISYMIS